MLMFFSTKLHSSTEVSTKHFNMKFNEMFISKEKIINNYRLKPIKLIRNNIIEINFKFNLCENHPILLLPEVLLLSK